MNTEQKAQSVQARTFINNLITETDSPHILVAAVRKSKETECHLTVGNIRKPSDVASLLLTLYGGLLRGKEKSDQETILELWERIPSLLEEAESGKHMSTISGAEAQKKYQK